MDQQDGEILSVIENAKPIVKGRIARTDPDRFHAEKIDIPFKLRPRKLPEMTIKRVRTLPVLNWKMHGPAHQRLKPVSKCGNSSLLDRKLETLLDLH
jgi:hypothetical protein